MRVYLFTVFRYYRPAAVVRTFLCPYFRFVFRSLSSLLSSLLLLLLLLSTSFYPLLVALLVVITVSCRRLQKYSR